MGPQHRRACPQRDRVAGHPHGQDRRRALARTAARIASVRRTGCRSRPTSRVRRSRWILENVDGARERADAGDLIFGNMDTWCIWNLTGGPDGGLHITDVSNASRTMLMDLATLNWDDELVAASSAYRKSMLPEIRPSSAVYGEVKGTALAGVPVAGDLGDQQAATFGQTCFSPGEAKNTYGTGNFLLLNTGTEAVAVEERPDHHGRLQDRRRRHAVYGLEGSIAITGVAGPVAARQPRADQQRARGRGARQDGRGQRRLLHRAGVLRPVRPVLEGRRPRRVRRADPLRQPGPHRPRDARGDGIPEPRGARRDERGLGRRRSSRSRSTAGWSSTRP